MGLHRRVIVSVTCIVQCPFHPSTSPVCAMDVEHTQFPDVAVSGQNTEVWAACSLHCGSCLTRALPAITGGATKKPIVSMPASKPSVAAAKPDTSSSAPSDGQKDASDDSSDEVSAVRNAALKIKDDSASLGRSLGASVRRGACAIHIDPIPHARPQRSYRFW